MATAKQLANLKKARAALAKKRKAGTVKKRTRQNPTHRKASKAKTPKKRTRQNTPRRTTAKARRVIRSGRSTRPSQEHVIMVNDRYFEGAGFTDNVKRAARYHSLDQAKIIAQRVADVTKKQTAIKLVKG